jgi:uncharacterized protein (TIGR01244 family)
MRLPSNKKLFWFAAFASLFFVLAVAGYDRWQRAQNALPSSIRSLYHDIWLSDQLQIDVLPKLKARGIGTIIDLRPDGEAADQPPSFAVESAARALQIEFAYIPVPHGDIPDSAVATLSKALESSPRPVLLYCRSGRRAARTWALAEASRSGGLDAEGIREAVAQVGQPTDGLDGAITRRITQRGDKK